jgi:hypothetical protein
MNEYANHVIPRDERMALVGEMGDKINNLDAVSGAVGITHLGRSLVLDPKDKEATVVGRQVVAFLAGMARENKAAVKRSLLFAEAAADASVNAKAHPEKWFSEFNKWMGVCGWARSGDGFTRYRAQEQRFTMDELGVRFLNTAIAALAGPGPAAALLSAVASEAVAALKSQQGPLRIFERNANAHNGSDYGIASALESDGDVYMALGSVAFNSSYSRTNFLFWEWQAQDVNIYKASNFWVLDLETYDDIKDVIRQKLGDRARTHIAELKF